MSLLGLYPDAWQPLEAERVEREARYLLENARERFLAFDENARTQPTVLSPEVSLLRRGTAVRVLADDCGDGFSLVAHGSRALTNRGFIPTTFVPNSALVDSRPPPPAIPPTLEQVCVKRETEVRSDQAAEIERRKGSQVFRYTDGRGAQPWRALSIVVKVK